MSGRHASKHNLLMVEGPVPLGLPLLRILDLHPVPDVVSLDDDGPASVPHVLIDDTHLLGDGKRGDWMVSGDHIHLDAGPLALGHGLGHTLPWRIDEGNQSHKGEIVRGEVWLWLIREGIVHRDVLEVAHREPEHALSHRTEALVRVLVLLPPLVRERYRLTIDENLRASVDDALRGALKYHERVLRGRILRLVDGQLPLVCRVELNLVELGVGFVILLDVPEKLHALDQRTL
mmetsp:Transcript_7255/g.19908  ORF Transcript_7255/g.19908 Transcript_7255/m.19908 type:complete len:233 (+) Transcript_7255:1960-2658(+)